MKTIVIDNSKKINAGSCPFSWFLIADSAVSNTGKPFYLPDENGRILATLSVAIKISRLGKSISPKFSYRYYSEMAPAVHFYMPDMEKELHEMGLPTDPAHNFDRALMVGDFIPFKPESEFRLSLNETPAAVFSFTNLFPDIDESISLLSSFNTLKMGDLILPGLSDPLALKQGDLLEIYNNGEKSFIIKIK